MFEEGNVRGNYTSQRTYCGAWFPGPTLSSRGVKMVFRSSALNAESSNTGFKARYKFLLDSQMTTGNYTEVNYIGFMCGACVCVWVRWCMWCVCMCVSLPLSLTAKFSTTKIQVYKWICGTGLSLSLSHSLTHSLSQCPKYPKNSSIKTFKHQSTHPPPPPHTHPNTHTHILRRNPL
jgi:hypothetical protein